MLTLQSDLHGNRLLGALPSEELRSFLPRLELGHLRANALLCDSGQRIRHIYFPASAIVSTLADGSPGSPVEITAGAESLGG